MFINSSFHGKQELAKTRTIRINKKEEKALLKPTVAYVTDSRQEEKSLQVTSFSLLWWVAFLLLLSNRNLN